MARPGSMRRAAIRRVAAVIGAVLLVAACGRVIAPPPPSGAPDTVREGRVHGDPRVIAPRAARRLQDMGFTTRRFATDSLWGWRAQEQMAARLRYAMGSGDSTRVLVELWGPCAAGRRGCLGREAAAILASLGEGEAAPQ
jgi:hypothetical protein